MQRITLESEISYVISEKELNEIRAEERGKMLMPYDVESVEELVANVRSKTIDEVISKWCDETCGVNRCVDYMDRCVFGEFLMKMKGDKA